MNKRRKEAPNGFTLLEVTIALVILVISASIAAMGVISWLPNYRLKGAAREIYSNMQKARSEAVKRNICIGIEFTTVTFPETGGGYTAFFDNGIGSDACNATHDGGEQVLFQIRMPTGCTLFQASFSGGSATGYNSRGLPLSNRTGSIEMRNASSRWYKMSLSNSGYPKITESSDGTSYR
jgi:type IV fimbrial biogenesis protein FimT